MGYSHRSKLSVRFVDGMFRSDSQSLPPAGTARDGHFMHERSNIALFGCMSSLVMTVVSGV